MSKHTHNHAQGNPDETGGKASEKDRAAEAGSAQEASSQAPGGGTGGGVQDAPEGAQAETAQLTPEAKIAVLEAKIVSLEAQLSEANGNYLRKAADFENYRKRMNREKQDAIDYANTSLLLDLIQTMDDFERAIKAAEETSKTSPEVASLYEGVSMIEKRLSSQLENKWGLKRFDSAGQPFDPNRHEAVMMDKSADAAEPVVAEEYYKGYTLKERVVRPAKVKVLMPGSPDAQNAGKDEGGSAPSQP
ncbi:MAG: nucleotide exchange factor GrpE [Treponema sp.]|jgi:molecular chaperone GrpE|nr:nucleotide exchange factor GrpE [Treponema sp.]